MWRTFQLILTVFTEFWGGERVKPSGNFRIIVSVFGSYNDELLQVCTQISWSLITESVDDRNLVDILQVSF